MNQSASFFAVLTLDENVDGSKSEIERQLDVAFLEACSLEGKEREGYLSGLPESLQYVVRQMLEDEQTLAPDFLEPVGVDLRRSGQTAFGDFEGMLPGLSEVDENAPRIKGFRIVRKIAEGGMGVVYLALQEPPMVRRVAIKVMPTQIRGSQLSRLRAEQQSGAHLDHQNIARMFDAGVTGEGYPYFVIEYVPGIPITEYCDKHQYSITQRLRLIEVVCDAVQYAHQKGFIHRDIKPSNILVAGKPESPIVKVIDFGLAKIIQDEELKLGLDTTREGDVMGTPLYMSPEQAKGKAWDVDTRADVYSIGVVLYELLTGTTPVTRERARELAHSALFDLIATEEPQLPSGRLKSLASGSEKQCVAKSRSIDARSLVAAVSGELDWIARKALEIERERRYRTPIELGQDIRRFLSNDLVLASPPSRLYHARKFVRRHRKSVLLATTFLSLLVASTVVLAILSVELQKESKKARDALWVSRQATEQATEERDRAEKLLVDLRIRDAEIQFKNKRLSELIASGFLLLESEYGASKDGVVALMEDLKERKRGFASEGVIPEQGSDDRANASIVARQLCFDAFTRFMEIANRINRLNDVLSSASTSIARSILIVTKMDEIMELGADIKTTRELIEKAIELEPSLGLAHLMKAEIDTRIYTMVSDYGDSLSVPMTRFTGGIREEEISRHWESATRLLPESTHAFTGRGFWHFQNGRIVEAEKDFVAAIAKDPTNDNAQRGLAELYDESARYAEAVDAFKKVFELPVKFSSAIVSKDYTKYYAGRIAVLTKVYLMDLEQDDLIKQVSDAATIRYYGAFCDEPIVREQLGILWQIVSRTLVAEPEPKTVELMEYVLRLQKYPRKQPTYESTRAFVLLVAKVCSVLGDESAKSGVGEGADSRELAIVQLELERLNREFQQGWECELTSQQLREISEAIIPMFGNHKELQQLFESVCKRARFVDLVSQPVAIK